MQNGFEHNSFGFEDRTFPKIDSESLSSTLSESIKRLDTFIDYLLIKSGAKWPKNDLSFKVQFLSCCISKTAEAARKCCMREL